MLYLALMIWSWENDNLKESDIMRYAYLERKINQEIIGGAL